MKRLVGLICVLIFSVVGCTHERSYKHDGEVTNVRLLTHDQFCNYTTSAGNTWKKIIDGQAYSNYTGYSQTIELYNKLTANGCKKEKGAEPKILPVAGVAAGAAINYAIGFIGDEIKKEAKKHTASFASESYFDDLMAIGAGQPETEYKALEITRYVKDDKNNKKTLAYKLIVGIWLDKSKQFFWASPLYFDTELAKAKIAKSKAKLTSTANVSLSALWIEQEKSYKFSKQEIAKFPPIIVQHYNLDHNHGITSTCDDVIENDKEVIFRCSKNPFPLIPITNRTNSHLWITVDVTEIDESKTEKYLTQAADALDKNKDKIVEASKNAIEGK